MITFKCLQVMATKSCMNQGYNPHSDDYIAQWDTTNCSGNNNSIIILRIKNGQ